MENKIKIADIVKKNKPIKNRFLLDEYNKKFGEQIAKVADIVILIGKKKTQPIKEGLLTSGFNKEQIVVFNDVREAYPYINNIAISMKEEVYALFENDLPDTYNEN